MSEIKVQDFKKYVDIRTNREKNVSRIENPEYVDYEKSYCPHCLWNAKKYPYDYHGPKPDFLDSYEVFNIFNMFARTRYAMNFVTKEHDFNYDLSKLIRIVNIYAMFELPKIFNTDIVPNYSIVHNSEFSLERGSKEHIHILLIVLPGNGYRKFMNDKYGLVQGTPIQFLQKEFNYVNPNNQLLDKIKSVDPDDVEQKYRHNIIDILKDVYNMRRRGDDQEQEQEQEQEKELQNKPSLGRMNLYKMLLSQIHELYGNGIYCYKKHSSFFDFNIHDKGDECLIVPKVVHHDISLVQQKMRKYIHLFESNLDLTNYFILIKSSHTEYIQEFLFEFVDDRRTVDDFTKLRKRINTMNQYLNRHSNQRDNDSPLSWRNNQKFSQKR